MKKLGIALIFIYVLLTLGLFSIQTREFAAIGVTIFLPVLMILAASNLLTGTSEYPNRKLLTICSALSLILFVLAGAFIEHIPSLWDYYNPTFYIATGLLIVSVGISVNNAFTGQLSSRGAIDIIILIVPVTAFFIFEVYQYNRFTDVSDIYGADRLTNEISETSQLIANSIIPESQELKFRETVILMEEFVNYTAEWTGGYKEGTMGYEFFAPNSHLPADLEVEWINKIRDSLNKDIESTSNEKVKEELLKVRQLFSQSATDNSALEMRLRLYAAQNRLLTLNLIE